MMRKKWSVFVTALLLMVVAAGSLQRLKANQKLGLPGIKTSPVPGSARLEVLLPEIVLDYKSESQPIDQGMLDGLPHDTSFGVRRYVRPDGSQLDASVVLMGTDRTSIHKPEFCLPGQGWNICAADSTKDTIHITRPVAYDLPVMKLVATGEVLVNGQRQTMRGIYVYWFVADGDVTNDHATRMRKSTVRLLRRDELERWAYVSCFVRCLPGNENAAYDQIKQFIAAAVPDFQLTP